MSILTVEQSDKIVDGLVKLVVRDVDFFGYLKEAPHWSGRWVVAEQYVLNILDEVGSVSPREYKTLWLRERFFYMMQKRTGMDFGYCQYFIPAFRNMTRSVLEDDYSIDMWHRCSYGDDLEKSTCAGTDRDMCVILHEKDSRKIPVRITNMSDLLRTTKGNPDYN